MGLEAIVASLGRALTIGDARSWTSFMEQVQASQIDPFIRPIRGDKPLGETVSPARRVASLR